MFDRIIDFVIESLGFFQFFTVINEDEKGVVYRLGRLNRVMECGLQFFIPCYIEQVFTESVVLDTRDLGSQTLTTKDGYQIVVTTVISFTVCDIVKTMTKIQTIESALEDIVYGVITSFIMNNNYEAFLYVENMDKIRDKANTKTEPLGIHLEGVHFMDIAEIRTIRIIGDNATYVDDEE